MDASASTSTSASALASTQATHDAASTHASQVNIPTSSTFRRLPGLNRPFRREKAMTPPTTSTPPTDPEPISVFEDGDARIPPRQSSHLLPPSRTSSLPVSPPIPGDPDASDLEPVTHPAHLAQSEPPKRAVTERAGLILDSQQASHNEEQDHPRRRRATTSTRAVRSEETARTRKHSAKKPVLIAQLPKAVVPKAAASAMYFSTVPAHGRAPEQPLRAHTGTLVGDKIWFLGGVDGRNCWRNMAWFDTETLGWSAVETFGEQLPPLRAHTTTRAGELLYLFGGGDGPTYSNDVWAFDTASHRFACPNIPKKHLPPPRRAHTTIAYKHFLVVFGGGNGQAALNDVWALDVSDPNHLVWTEWVTTGDVPQKKGYHTSNLVGDKMIVFGGSDGHASFADVHVLNLNTLVWTLVNTDVKHNRLSHTSTRVGSYLFIIGGHNGQTYAQDVLLFNLVTLQWETKVPKGSPPSGRGYHAAVLHDARIYISGGYNGVNVFDDLWSLDLSAGAYLPQVTTFEVDETSARNRQTV